MNAVGNILIADNNPDNFKVLSAQLETLTYNIRIASDGISAWESIQADPPDLILAGILLHGMDGYDLCRQIKNDERYEDIPIILISNSDESFDKEKFFQVGSADYLLKPFVKEKVLSRVKTHLEHYKYQKNL